MLILGISTSSNIASVAISKDTECIKELNINNNKTHSETLVALINELLNETNVKLQDMNSYSGEPTNTLYIGDVVVANTDAKEDLDKENSAFSPYGLMMSNNRNFGGKTYVKYDYVYTKLSKNLDKEVSRQD